MEPKSIKEVPKGDLDRRLDSGASFCSVRRFLVSFCWRHLGDFVPFGRPLDFEGIPKSAFLLKNQHKINKRRSKKYVTRDMIFDWVFRCQDDLEIELRHDTCCNLNSYGGIRMDMKMNQKGIQQL